MWIAWALNDKLTSPGFPDPGSVFLGLGLKILSAKPSSKMTWEAGSGPYAKLAKQVL